MLFQLLCGVALMTVVILRKSENGGKKWLCHGDVQTYCDNKLLAWKLLAYYRGAAYCLQMMNILCEAIFFYVG
jgi:hypothetical protein